MKSPTTLDQLGIKLGAYSLATAAFLAVAPSALQAQITYTDISPDLLVKDLDSSTYTMDSAFIDLDGDGVFDFKVGAQRYYIGTPSDNVYDARLTIEPLGANGVMLNPSEDIVITEAGNYIGSSKTFSPYAEPIVYSRDTYTYSSWSTSCRPGSSFFGISGCVGLRFEIAGQFHYGWVRFFVNGYSEGLIEDFAFTSTPETPLYTCQGGNSGAYISAHDGGNTLTGEDLKFTIVASSQESLIDEYRVMAVPLTVATGFDSTAALAVMSPNYKLVYPAGALGYDGTFDAAGHDVEGNLIDQSNTYALFVLSTGPSGYTELSEASSLITFDSSIAKVSAITVELPTDTMVPGLEDINVSFTTTDITDIASYRIFLKKLSSAWPLATTLDTLSLAHYVEVAPGTSPGSISTSLDALLKDTDGDSFQYGVKYRALVLSVSGTSGTPISANSGHFEVREKAYGVKFFGLNDIGTTSTGSDLRARFVGYVDHPAIKEYRVFLVPQDSVATFTIGDALSTAADRFEVVTPPITTAEKANHYHIYSPSSLDVLGNLLLPTVNYKLYVLSVGWGDHIDNLSQAVSVGSFNDDANLLSASEPINVTVTNSYATGTGDDVEIAFENNTPDYNVGEYRLIIRSETSLIHTANSAALLPADRYISVSYASGSTAYFVPLSAGTLDQNGDPLETLKKYKVDILSIYDGPFDDLGQHNLAVDLNEFVPIFPLPAVPAVTISDVGDQGDGSDIQIEMTGLADETGLDEYRVMIARADLASTAPDLLSSLVASEYNSLPLVGPSGSATTLFNVDSRSLDNKLIKNGAPYQVYNLAYGENGASISPPSNEIVLHDPALEVNNPDISYEPLNGLTLYFDAADKHDLVSLYRVGLIPSGSDLGMYPVRVAQLSTSLVPVAIYNSSFDHFYLPMSLFLQDMHGEDIVEGMPYECIILTTTLGSLQIGQVITRKELHFVKGALSGLDTPSDSHEITIALEGNMLHWNDNLPIGATIKIYAINGQMLYEAAASGVNQLAIPELSPGMYIVSFEAESETFTGRFVK